MLSPQVAVPRITFVGGTKLSSTGTLEESQDPIKVYPPGAAASVAGSSGREENVRGAGEGGSVGGGGAEGAVSQGEKAEEEESKNDPDPVGESRFAHTVVSFACRKKVHAISEV